MPEFSRTKYANCPCPGVWKEKLTRWVIVEFRPNNHNRLKCLDCGWKWISRRKYAAKLPFWTPRSRSGLTDADVLQRLRSGNLLIDPETAEVTSTLRGHRVLTQVEDQHGSGYRFVKINWQGRQKKVAVHRLQWMAQHNRLVPEGFDIHHKMSPPRPFPKSNRIGNLELRESLENQTEGHLHRTGNSEAPF